MSEFDEIMTYREVEFSELTLKKRKARRQEDKRMRHQCIWMWFWQSNLLSRWEESISLGVDRSYVQRRNK